MDRAHYIDKKLKIGIFGFTGCAGDQLVIIHDEDRLLDYFMNAEIKSFIMASSESDNECDLDVAFVEGSINTEEEIKELNNIRKRAKLVIAIGNCAMHGGIQAGLFGDGKWEERYKAIYGDQITLTSAFEPTPISTHVKVDLSIPGCPIDKDQIYNAFSRLVHGIPLQLVEQPVCQTCKIKENYCLLEDKVLCLGPITDDGCQAACPSNNVACMGCYGLYSNANLPSFVKMGEDLGYSKERILTRLSCHGGATLQKHLKAMKISKGENGT